MFLVQVLETLVSVCPAIKYGMLYTKNLERIKYLSLLSSNDNFESIITLPNSCQEDIVWWLTNLKTFV